MELYQSLFLVSFISTSNSLFTDLLGCYGGPCAGTEGGRLKSPAYPAPYPARQSVKYELETNYGARISLKFNSFDLEQSAMCQYDSVKIIDSDGAEMGPYCGATSPPTFTSVTNKLTIEFTSDVAKQGGGFEAEWSKVPMSGSSKVIKSPNYPANYPSCYQDRVDVFQGKRGSKVKIDIVSFDIASPDLVMVFEGTPSYTDVKAIFGEAPGCPSNKNKNRKQKEKMKQRFSSNLTQILKSIKQNQIIFGFEFIAVLVPGSNGQPINAISPSPSVVTSLTSRTNTVSVWLLSDISGEASGFEFKLSEM